MTEWEKMLAGQTYDDNEPILCKMRDEARSAAKAYYLAMGDNQTQKSILQGLLGKMGEGVDMTAPIAFDYGKNTEIGDHCFFNFNTTILDCAKVIFGRHVLVGPNCSFLTPIHPLHKQCRRGMVGADGMMYRPERAKPIFVGDDVWIGGNVVINGGVTIGEGAVIASGSVVTKDIPPYVLAAGVPCRVLRPIGDEEPWFEES